MLFRVALLCSAVTMGMRLRGAESDATRLSGAESEQDVEVKFYDLSGVDERAKPFNKTEKKKRLPCSCQGYTCGCCAGMNIVTLNFNRRACMNITYDPDEFALSTNMLMNDKTVYKNKVSAKNPKPVCLPLPVPFVPVRFDFCTRLFNIFTPGKNIHLCLDFEARVMRRPVVVLHFDCLRLGANGIAHVKPEAGGGLGGDEEDGDGDGEDGDGDGDGEGGDGGDDVDLGGEAGGSTDTGAVGPEPPVEEDYDEITEEKKRHNNTLRV